MRRVLLPLLLLAFPAAAQTPPQPPPPPDPGINQLLGALRTAPDEQVASALEAQIEQEWLQQGTPAVTLLMKRALREAQAGTDKDALEDFNAALDLDPNQAEAWHRKALVQYHMGDVTGAIRDLEHALTLEPRDFAALQSLSQIAEARGNWKGAYSAWQKVMQLDPKTPGGQDRLRTLRRHALGEET
jgi:tetratricopeptide (TPR) repeat protein